MLEVFFLQAVETCTLGKITDLWSSPFWGNIPDKPSQFPPEPHASSHALGGSDELSLDASQITSGTLALDRLPIIPYAKTDFADQDLRTSASPNFTSLKIGGKEVISSDRRLKNIQFGEVREARADQVPESVEITPDRGAQFIPVWARAHAGTGALDEKGAADIIKLLNPGKRIVKLKAITDYDGHNTTARVIAVDEDNNEIVLCSSGAPGQTTAIAVVRAWEI